MNYESLLVLGKKESKGYLLPFSNCTRTSQASSIIVPKPSGAGQG